MAWFLDLNGMLDCSCHKLDWQNVSEYIGMD